LLRVEAAENDLREVVDNVAVRAAEARDEAGRVRCTPERERSEVDTCRPPLGALVEDVERAGVEAEAQPLVEEGGLLVLGEAQVESAELDELPGGSELGDRNRWIRPTRQHELDTARLRVHEVRERFVTGNVVDRLVVVEDEHQL